VADTTDEEDGDDTFITFFFYINSLRICAKQWDLGYDELMSNFDVCTLTPLRMRQLQL